MTHAVKKIFYTLQGEGVNTGRAAILCCFAGCNLWSGREVDRATAVCQLCDTDSVGTDGIQGGKYTTADALADTVATEWPASATGGKPLAVCTGGESPLQLDKSLIDALHARGFEIAIETNGITTAPEGIDWVCVGPKMGSELVVTCGDELKVVIPQDGQDLDAYERLDFRYFFLQAMDSPFVRQNTAAAVELCQRRPRWRLLLQTHKMLGIHQGEPQHLVPGPLPVPAISRRPLPPPCPMTKTVSITRRLESDTGHCIPGHVGQCRNLHGHRYQLEFTLTGEVLRNDKAADDGMILDFGDVKQLANRHLVDLWDHALFVYRGDTKLVESLNDTEGGHRTAVLNDIPTVENFAQVASDILKLVSRNTFGHHLRLSKFVLYETPNC